MIVILELAFKNLKRYAREAALVILSILLTISMMTMIASTMSSLYSSLMVHRIKTGQNIANADVSGITDVKGFVDEIREDVSSYYIDGYAGVYTDEEGLYVSANAYQTCQLDDIEAWCLRNEITEGRRSENKNEIVVQKDSKYNVGDILSLNHYENGENIGTIEVTVVGRNESLRMNDFYVSEEEMSQSENVYSVSFVFKDGSKNIDTQLKNVIDSNKYTDEHVYLDLNHDYNFFKGMQSKPGTLLITTASVTMIMLLLVGLATISLILNAFESLITQQEKSIGTLRSIGMTKDQLRGMILSQGFLLSSIGLCLGILLGVGLGHVLISYVFKNMNHLFETLGVDQSLEIFFYTSRWMYLVTIISGFVIIYLAQRKKLKELFAKTSIETLREHKLSNKNVRVDLRKNPIKGLAKINTKMTKDFKGIQTALMVSVILLIGINGWINSFTGAFSVPTQAFDSAVEINGSSESNVRKDIIKIMNVLNNVDEIEEMVQVDTIQSLQLTDNNSFDSLNDDNQVDSSFLEYIPVKILQDDYFKQFIKDEGLNAETETVFFNTINIQTEGESTTGHLIDFSKGDELELTNTDANEIFSLKVGSVVEEASEKYAYLYLRPQLIVSESFYQENLSAYPESTSSIYIKSELNNESINRLKDELESLDLENEFRFSSTFFDSYFMFIINKTIFTITAAIFIYIALVILINVLNISLSTYQIRKQDIAILMSVGASKEQIKKMFLRESLLISFKPYLKGLVVGNIIAFGMIKLTSSLLQGPISYKLSPIVLLVSLGLVLVIILVQYIVLVSENKKLDLISDIKSY